MYLPAQFREDRLDVQHALIRGHPFGALVTATADGPEATHIPWVLHGDEGPLGTLRGHVARPNPHWRAMDGQPSLIIFQGTERYITPSWYATKREHGRVVPTWNYALVHVRGRVRLTEDPEWLLRHLERLVGQNEERRQTRWSISDAPEAYVRGQLKGIVGVEVPIERIEGKWKLSQNRSVADRAGVVAGLRHDEGDDAAALTMANLVEERMPRETATD